MSRVVVIPAAGTGSRLGGDVPKALVRVDGRPMIEHLLSLYAPHASGFIVVVSPAASEAVGQVVRDRVPGVEIAIQTAPTGMLDAILIARRTIEQRRPRRILVTWCDQIAVAPETVAAVITAADTRPEPAVVLPTCRSETPYVHLRRDTAGTIVDVLHRREGDAMPRQGESDAGVFDLSLQAFLEWLPEYAAAPAIGTRTGERNFVPFVAWSARRGLVLTVDCRFREEAIGINTPEDLSVIEAYLRARRSS